MDAARYRVIFFNLLATKAEGLRVQLYRRGRAKLLPTHLVLTPAPVNMMTCLLWRTHSAARSTFLSSCSSLSKNSLFSSSSLMAGLNLPLPPPPVPTTGRWRSTVCTRKSTICFYTSVNLVSKLLVNLVSKLLVNLVSKLLCILGPLLTSVGFRSLLFALKAAASGLSSPPSSSSGDLTSSLPPVGCEYDAAGTGLLRLSVSCVD